MGYQKIIVAAMALILIPVSANAFLWWDDDRAKQEKYRSRVDEKRVELQELQFQELMAQNRELIAENRTLYQRSMRSLSAMGGPGLIYGALAVFLGIILFLVYLLFRLATSNRRPSRELKHWQPPPQQMGRITEEEQIQNQFRLLGEGGPKWRM